MLPRDPVLRALSMRIDSRFASFFRANASPPYYVLTAAVLLTRLDRRSAFGMHTTVCVRCTPTSTQVCFYGECVAPSDGTLAGQDAVVVRAQMSGNGSVCTAMFCARKVPLARKSAVVDESAFIPVKAGWTRPCHDRTQLFVAPSALCQHRRVEPRIHDLAHVVHEFA